MEYVSGKRLINVELENVTKTEVDPEIYASIWKKYEAYVNAHGSMLDLISYDPKVMKAKLAKIRGNVNQRGFSDDWYTFISANEEYHKYQKAGHGIVAQSEAEARRIHGYLTTNPARFGLALLKFSSDLTTGGAMGLVPRVDFNRNWTDQAVYDLLKLTRIERKAIDDALPDYYNRKSATEVKSDE